MHRIQLWISKILSYQAVWALLSILAASASLSIVVYVIARVNSGETNQAALLIIILQSVVSLLAGGSLTKPGKKILRDFYILLGLSNRFHALAGFIFSLACLGLILFSYLVLMPWYSFRLANKGISYFMDEQYDKARNFFVNAVELNPDNQIAQYYLGAIVEKADTEKASNYYNKVIDLGGSPLLIARAQNNLGMIEADKKKWTEAIEDFQLALSKVSDERQKHEDGYYAVKYSVLKNMSYAYHNLNDFQKATYYAEQAITIKETELVKRSRLDQRIVENKEGQPYCILADSQEKTDKNIPTCSIWHKCLSQAVEVNKYERSWIPIAERKYKNCRH